jgi:hypothetical protein
MKKQEMLHENSLGHGLYIFKFNKELLELKGNDLNERIKFAVKDFLKLPEKERKDYGGRLPGRRVSR